MILAGDIGGTKVHLASYDRTSGLKAVYKETYPSRKYDNFTDILKDFRAKHQFEVRAACFGVAGPIKDGQCVATNLPWIVNAREISGLLDLAPTHLLNDLEANAYGIELLRPDELVTIQEGSVESEGNRALISAGTGLGEAGLYWDEIIHRPFATEGGHANFAPETDLDVELFLYLRDKFGGHVSWERVLSGMGLVNIHAFLAQRGDSYTPGAVEEAMKTEDPAAVISRYGLEGSCPICVETLDIMTRYYGSEAGNLALKVLAIGGVYIGGGIAPKILPKLQSPIFLQAFLNKGRMGSLLSTMPLRVILNQETALLGAAKFAMRRVTQPAG